MSLVESMTAKWVTAGCVLLLGVGLGFGQTAASTKKSTSGSATHSKTAHKTSSHGKSKHSKKSASWRRGQQKIDPPRAREIQEALIRQHYLSGEASGKWDDASQKAMEKFQEDNGWQSKMVPDSRALIKLGLGPDHQHLLNPESAMTTAPAQAPVPTKGVPPSTPPQR